MLLAMAIAWIVCGILTITDWISPDNPARTDFKLEIINQSSWFRIPYPCKD